MTPTAVVTGASSGIGRAIVERLLADGVRVLGVSRRGDLPDGAVAVPGDLADDAGVHAAVDVIRARLAEGDGDGRVDAIVHAAGLQVSGRLGQLADGGERMWRLNVASAELLCDALVGDLCDGGRIVLVGSRTMVGVAGKSQYAATKAALAAMARSWAAELAPRRITVNVVAPGPTDTPMLSDPGRAATPPRVPALGRLIEPSEVAALTGFLLGPDGAMITGQTLVMCGGASLGLPG